MSLTIKITVLIPFQSNMILKRPHFPEYVGGTLNVPLACLENHGLF